MKYEKRVEQHQITNQDSRFKEADHLCWLSKNLYNATLYTIRHYYFETKKYLGYNKVSIEFAHSNNPDYRALPAKVSKGTQRLVDKNFKSFYNLRKKGYFARIPNYLDTKKGRQIVHYEKGAISFSKKKGYIHLSQTDIYIKTNLTKQEVKFVRIVPMGNHIVFEIGYDKLVEGMKKDNGRYASIDLGIDNLMTISSNVLDPFIINGKPVKSMNVYYNKLLSKNKKLIWKLNKQKSSNRIQSIHRKRKNKIMDYFHKSTRYVVNQLVSNQVNTLIIGYNKGWKQDTTMRKSSKQTFIQIPFYTLIQILIYKCKENGINVIIQEESYTSKSSFLDLDNIPVWDNKKNTVTFSGKRVKRGLYKSKEGKLINADLNGSLNILRKYLEKQEAWNEKLFSNLVEVCSKPLLIRLNF